MTDYEAQQVIIKTTELRMSSPYRAAEALRRSSGADPIARSADMARAAENSPEYAAIRLLIGTWERIAMFIEDFNEPQRRRFFRCHPVLMAWTTMSPAVQIIRASGLGSQFAAEFERLADQYRHWTHTAEGEQYRTEAQQAVCALFF